MLTLEKRKYQRQETTKGLATLLESGRKNKANSRQINAPRKVTLKWSSAESNKQEMLGENGLVGWEGRQCGYVTAQSEKEF